MELGSLKYQSGNVDVGVYDCEIRIKFRLIEDKSALRDRDRLLELLLDAFSCGADDYLETVVAEAEALEISEVDASPHMRRQLIRLRNSSDLA